MSAEASGGAAAQALSLEVPKPSGLEPGTAAYGLKPLTPNSKYVKLNVGGSLHYTTLRTLTAQDSMLKAMFSGRAEVITDAGGWVLIDRSGRHFGTILNYLRDGSVPLPESTRELGELLGEARYYLVQGLIEDCQLALQNHSCVSGTILLVCTSWTRLTFKKNKETKTMREIEDASKIRASKQPSSHSSPGYLILKCNAFSSMLQLSLFQVP